MSLERIVQLANLMVQQRQEVERLKGQLQTAEQDLRRLETEDLPELMREIGMQSVRLADGSTIEVVDEVECAITDAKRAAAHAWLSEHGFGGLIKTEVVVGFGRGEHEAAVACAESVGGELKERVHPATLKSFIKEQMAAGTAIPFDLFGVYPYAKAKFKSAK